MLLLTSVFSWAREFYVSETKLQYGMHSFGSVRGVSGHVHNPFAGKPLLQHEQRVVACI
jgi:alpha-galactosidase